jgi:hypothetical protein
VYALQREDIPLEGLADGGALELHCEAQGYGLRLWGALPEDLPLGDCRVYLRLEQDGEVLVFEAFPICEAKLLDGNPVNGFSAFLSKDAGLSGEYRVTVITENIIYHCGAIAAE